jgi:hypothetical protein
MTPRGLNRSDLKAAITRVAEVIGAEPASAPSRPAKWRLDRALRNRPGGSSAHQRVPPAQPWEPGKIGISTLKFGLMLHRHRGQLGVGGQVSSRA